jgi:hypothetical protein
MFNPSLLWTVASTGQTLSHEALSHWAHVKGW